jgi:hypothetical protein
MKAVVAVVMLGIMSASGGILIQDRFTGFNAEDAVWLAAHNQAQAPGWALGSKPFGHWLGSWEYIPSFTTRMSLGIKMDNLPVISLNKPIHLTPR